MVDGVTALEVKSGGPAKLRWTAGLVVGMVLLTVIALVSFVAPVLMGDAANGLTEDTSLPPTWAHPLGTDRFGRDMLARALNATQLSIIMTVAATVISVLFGVLIGTSIRVAPGWLRSLSLRMIEIAVSYPSLLIAVVIAAILQPGTWQLVIAIGVSGIPQMARLASTLAASVFERDFVMTAHLLGVPNRFIITRHLLPNMAEPLLVQTAQVFSFGLIAVSALSFVGLGVQTPQYDLGRLLADGLPSIYSNPLELVGAIVMIILVSLAALLIGDGLAAGADPRQTLKRQSFLSEPASGAPVAPDADGPLVSVRNLTVRKADGNSLVHGVSFSMRSGEILGVVGESGSGKSLTAMSLAQLLQDGLHASADELRIGTMNMLRQVSKKTLATSVAFVYQDPGTTFNPALKMRSQLTEVLRVHQKQSRRDARRIISEILVKARIVDPDKVLDSRPHELSGGMRQRAMIASALATNPILMIADEPTTALDVTVQVEILREFKRINREREMSVLFISHDIGVVEELCDRIIVMKDGEIVEELSREALKSRCVSHPYTRRLLSAVPRFAFEQK